MACDVWRVTCDVHLCTYCAAAAGNAATRSGGCAVRCDASPKACAFEGRERSVCSEGLLKHLNGHTDTHNVAEDEKKVSEGRAGIRVLENR